MNVFVAGASGAIGRPLIAELVRRCVKLEGERTLSFAPRRLQWLG